MIKPRFKKGDLAYIARQENIDDIFNNPYCEIFATIDTYEILEDAPECCAKWAEYYKTAPDYAYKVKLLRTGQVIDGFQEKVLFTTEREAKLNCLKDFKRDVENVLDELKREIGRVKNEN